MILRYILPLLNRFVLIYLAHIYVYWLLKYLGTGIVIPASSKASLRWKRYSSIESLTRIWSGNGIMLLN